MPVMGTVIFTIYLDIVCFSEGLPSLSSVLFGRWVWVPALPLSHAPRIASAVTPQVRLRGTFSGVH